MGILLEDIHKFADGNYWLEFFPELCAKDLKDFGARIDWRRQFVTTDLNPFYDSFVRWQMNRLHQMNKVQYGNRYTIYNPKDDQPCMDHDRSEGETLGPVEYTALKLKVKRWSPVVAKAIEGTVPQDASVYFIPVTLRPETILRHRVLYLHEASCVEYGISRNIFEDFPSAESELQPVVDLPGSVFVGTLVNAPLSVHTEGIRILPMDSVSATKGTGVVTCVPSDSLDDYAMIRELIKKSEYYGIEKEWAELEIIPVIETPTYGNLTAKKLIQDMKIHSPKDTSSA
ncbi:hypothetical protein DTO271D3_4216 [Paecilomyces variotii]|nr:hypothetical protein DTO169C6_4281 [Paecilomyces variotii]KAJ9315643.1 hypothetical protein DTO271D3_4216 [Paecilomyces variotii]KAJ9406861.1 hypothetical protein DTO045G8_5527 [Paecilomyces variotii]